jgi:predicted ATP-binding protein involved in virulence
LNSNDKIKENFEFPFIRVLNCQGKMMKIMSIDIEGVGGINKLTLDFIDGVNVLCGPNGIGKSTILDIIADAFSSGSASKLRRNALFEKGNYSITIEDTSGNPIQKSEIVNDFQPIATTFRVGWQDMSNRLFSFGIERNINYTKLQSISPDPERKSYTNGQLAISGIHVDDIKNWFVNRYLFIDKTESLAKEQMDNFELAVRSFGILDHSIKFKTVNARSFDIELNTNTGDIYFEYLSSGYKSCIYIIFGIIKEIEYRFIENPIMAHNFDGVILIDEVDLHLHPTWQAGLINALKIIFPKAQFILTTHSPSILQVLEKNEIIALEHDDKGNTTVKDLQLGEYGLQGWTLEEILKDVMGMPSTTSQLYQDTINKFDEALDEENVEDIKKYYNLLLKMLHPNSVMRRLLQIQIAGFEE